MEKENVSIAGALVLYFLVLFIASGNWSTEFRGYIESKLDPMKESYAIVREYLKPESDPVDLRLSTGKEPIPSSPVLQDPDGATSADHDISGSFLKTDFAYDRASGSHVFGQTARNGQIYYAYLDGASDDTTTTVRKYCGWDGEYYDYPTGWNMERKMVTDDKYEIKVYGLSAPDCSLGQPQNTGWFKLDPDSGWKITDTIKCKVNQDNDSNGIVIDTYCTVDRDKGEVRWQSGSMCGGCCACANGAVVEIDVMVERG